jgi:hypothetical protein
MCRLTKRKISSRSAAATFEGEFSDLTRDRHLSILGSTLRDLVYRHAAMHH